ncbi:MAG: hypothetical protein R6U50_11290 [Desulfobacterales bacterium]
MKRDDVYWELKKAITNFLARQTDEDSKFDIEMTVEKYFEEEVSKYSPEELAEFAGTPESILRHFKHYLDNYKKILDKPH